VQQLDLGALDEAQFEQAALQLDLMLLMVTMAAPLDNDAAVAASGLAQLYRIGQI